MNAREELLDHVDGREVEFVEITMMKHYDTTAGKPMSFSHGMKAGIQ